MLTMFKRLFSGGREGAKADPASSDSAMAGLEPAQVEDIERFLEAARRADAQGHSPWVLRDEARLETLRRALEFTAHRGLWLQRDGSHVARWQGRLLKLRHGEGPTLGMLLACRADDEAAWQLRFFYVDPEWQGSGHGARLLRAARDSLNGVPLHVRLPLACQAAVCSLEKAGFKRMHVNAFEVASFEAPAEWD
ncbi:GNAT family N-acetyltransferase [Halomonas sp. ANAO-440]|uniref:GNAT family N-acetyltransferase n=1 Tax=Halomonas sp. ANAO-440 TaxID=2861360 RepID=UPI001CAA70CF|nr:GNAT family N-acetyltransferase [Halomonas sp. ANAO-440]MBZ0331569.1 GNAT family N-acetyltransferase [Halomonas sp. ANAO-440]